jgi:hypothetical protein
VFKHLNFQRLSLNPDNLSFPYDLAAMPLLCRSYKEALSPHKVKPLLTKASAISCPNARHQSTSSAPSSSHQVIFSGIQPTGVPHLGNYLGALKQWVHLQNTVSPSTKLFYSVVDWHAGTTPYNPRQLRIWKRETLATLLAVGLDESRCVMFHQSSVRFSLHKRGSGKIGGDRIGLTRYRRR